MGLGDELVGVVGRGGGDWQSERARRGGLASAVPAGWGGDWPVGWDGLAGWRGEQMDQLGKPSGMTR